MDIINNYEVITYQPKEDDKYDLYQWYTRETTVYYLNKLKHRDNDLPALINSNFKKWYQYGKLHRSDDKPAVISNNLKMWLINGKLHRDNDQPAIIAIDIPHTINLNDILLSGTKFWFEYGVYIRHQ